MRIDKTKKSGPKKCTYCMRKKEEAIREHIKTMSNCDHPDCPFRNEIQDAIEKEKNKPKFEFGPVKKSPIKFGKK